MRVKIKKTASVLAKPKQSRAVCSSNNLLFHYSKMKGKCQMKCRNCGHEDAFDEFIHKGEEFLINDIYCPNCHSDDVADDDEVCEYCGMICGSLICDECAKEYSYKYEICEKISEKAKETIKLPALITSVLDTETITKILYQFIEESNISCEPFIMTDKDWFYDEVKKLDRK